MAMDTRRKRMAAIAVALPWMAQVYAPATGFDEFDRGAALGLYDMSTMDVVVGCVQAMAIYQPGAQAAQVGCQ